MTRSPEPSHHLNEEQSKRIYLAKCEDLGILPTPVREDRFMTILNRSCSGEDFDLRDNGIAEKSGQIIASVLQTDTHYRTLNLAGNTIRNPGAQALADLLRSNRTLTSIDLRSNDVGIEGGIAIFNALSDESNTTLTSLDLSGMSGINRNHIGRAGAEAVEKALRNNRAMKKLSFRENGFGIEGAMAIARGLRFNSSLTYLDLGSNSIGPEGAKYLAESIVVSELAHLFLSRNNIGDGGAIVVAEILVGSRKLQTLDISVNKITPLGGKHLGDSLRENNSLVHLIMDHNDLGSAGLRNLSEALRENTTLQTLVLGSNKIEGRGAQELAEAIKNNRAITSLDLSHNSIGNEGATAFGIALKFNRSLLSLDLSHNKIGNIGGDDFASNLQHNQTLQHLSLKNNSMQEKTGELLANFLRSNNTLLSLDITFNDFNYKHINILEKKIKQNVKTYKAAAIDRYRREIGTLYANQVKLEETESRLSKEKAQREREEERVMESLKALETAELDEKIRIKELKESIAEQTAIISKTEAKTISLTHESTKIRADKEARYWTLVQKLHKEKDSNNRLEKRIKSKKTQIEELKIKFDKEITSREEQHRIILFDRAQAEQDYINVAQQVEKMKAILSEHVVELAPTEPSKREDRFGMRAPKPTAVSRFPSIKSR